MSSVYNEIIRLKTAKEDIETAIEICGVNVPDTSLISTYASYIRLIPSTILSNLNVDELGGVDQYIKSIKQENGLIEATTGGLVSSSSSGLSPKIENNSGLTISNLEEDWVLTSTNGNSPTWRRLPTQAFDQVINYNPTNISLDTTWKSSGLILNTTNGFSSGTYAIKILKDNLIFSGTVSVYVGNITIEDEILLHMSGRPQTFKDGTQGRIYAKIAPSNNADYGELYLSTNVPEANITNLSITMKKLI